MWFTYIIYSLKLDKYYTGYCEDLAKRIERHNLGWGKYTSKANDWEIIYSERYNTKSEAIKREKDIKKKKVENILKN